MADADAEGAELDPPEVWLKVSISSSNQGTRGRGKNPRTLVLLLVGPDPEPDWLGVETTVGNALVLVVVSSSPLALSVSLMTPEGLEPPVADT